MVPTALEETNDHVFDVLQELDRLYRSVDEPMKRRVNRGLFSKVLIDDGPSRCGRTLQIHPLLNGLRAT